MQVQTRVVDGVTEVNFGDVKIRRRVRDAVEVEASGHVNTVVVDIESGSQGVRIRINRWTGERIVDREVRSSSGVGEWVEIARWSSPG